MQLSTTSSATIPHAPFRVLSLQQPQFQGHKLVTALTTVGLVLASSLRATATSLPPELKLPASVTGQPLATCGELFKAFKQDIAPKLIQKIEAIQGKAKTPQEINSAVRGTDIILKCGQPGPSGSPPHTQRLTFPILRTTPNNACTQIGETLANSPERTQIRELIRRSSHPASWQLDCYLPTEPKPVTHSDRNLVQGPAVPSRLNRFV